MSVHGEFRRTLHGCLDHLRGSPTPAAHSLVRELRRAEERARDDLSAAARRVIELCDPPGEASLFEAESAAREYRAQASHLVELCRAIAGRPVP